MGKKKQSKNTIVINDDDLDIQAAEKQADKDNAALRELGAFSSVGSDVINNALTGLQNLGQFSSNNIAAYENAIKNYENLGKFQYNLAGDPLFNQYKDTAVTLGKTAMQDTMGQAAALTGGYGNSYATAAGQQVYNQYLNDLNNRIPELYNLALNTYNTEAGRLQNLASMYGNAVNQDLNVYNTKAGYWNDLLGAGSARLNADASIYGTNFDRLATLAGLSREELNTLLERAYRAERDKIADEQWQKTFDYQGERDAISDEQWRETFDYQKEQDAITNAIASTPTVETPKVFQYGTGRVTHTNLNAKSGDVTYTDANGNKITVEAGFSPYVSGNRNPDVLDKDGNYDPSKAFDNGYQPNNITVGGKNYKLKKYTIDGEQVEALGAGGYWQNVWKVKDGTYAVWNYTKNAYDLYSKDQVDAELSKNKMKK